MSEPTLPSDGEPAVDLTAAEWVLGLLEGDARDRAARRLTSDPAFAAEAAAWAERFAPLLDEIAEATPPERVWTGIAAGLPSPPRRQVWWRGAGSRRAAYAVALAAAAACVFLILPGRRSPAPPIAAPPTSQAPLVARLATPGGKVLFVADLDAARTGVTITPVGPVAAAGRSPELWVIPADGKARAVGVFDAAAPRSLRVARSVLALAGPKVVLAVSLEPPGGSPTGAATGPVIATGALVAL